MLQLRVAFGHAFQRMVESMLGLGLFTMRFLTAKGGVVMMAIDRARHLRFRKLRVCAPACCVCAAHGEPTSRRLHQGLMEARSRSGPLGSRAWL